MEAFDDVVDFLFVCSTVIDMELAFNRPIYQLSPHQQGALPAEAREGVSLAKLPKDFKYHQPF